MRIKGNARQYHKLLDFMRDGQKHSVEELTKLVESWGFEAYRLAGYLNDIKKWENGEIATEKNGRNVLNYRLANFEKFKNFVIPPESKAALIRGGHVVVAKASALKKAKPPKKMPAKESLAKTKADSAAIQGKTPKTSKKAPPEPKSKEQRDSDQKLVDAFLEKNKKASSTPYLELTDTIMYPKVSHDVLAVDSEFDDLPAIPIFSGDIITPDDI